MKKIFMAVIALMMTISASAQFYVYFSDGTVAKVDSISLVAPEDTEKPEPSAGIGTFSVAADKQVSFAPGNLQYAQSTNTWSFAENQYSCIGTDNATGGTTSSNQYGDSRYGEDLADKIDLFGFSTDSTNFGVMTSTSANDYLGSFVDWGTNQIGTDAPNTWRTLSEEEWLYLLNNRTDAATLKGVAQVNGINGMIFLPDNWVCPSDVTFKSGFGAGYLINHYADHQTFTAEEWSKLEAAGAVFLPTAGNRGGTNVYDIQYCGYYWSATEVGSNGAKYLIIYPDASGVNYYNRASGYAVRLVKDL